MTQRKNWRGQSHNVIFLYNPDPVFIISFVSHLNSGERGGKGREGKGERERERERGREGEGEGERDRDRGRGRKGEGER